MSFGTQEAERILREREQAAARAAEKDRSERILSAEPARYLDAVGEMLKADVESFNESLSLPYAMALTATSSSGLIQLGKRSHPTVLVRLTYNHSLRLAVVRVEATMDYRRVCNSEAKWYFTVDNDEVQLDGKTSLECSPALLSLVTQFCH